MRPWCERWLRKGQHGFRWSAIVSIVSKIGCAAQRLNEWVRKARVESGRRVGIPTGMAGWLKALERENRDLRQVEPWSAIGLKTMAREILRKASAYVAMAVLDRRSK